MQYREMKDNKVSLLGFGAMRMPVLNGDMTKIDEPEAIKMIRHAIDSGVNYVDTAYFYHGGNSEAVVGKALKDGYREKAFLADKMPASLVSETDDFEKLFTTQFERLDVEYIDYYLVHSLNKNMWEKMKNLGIIEFLEKKKAAGKIRYIGFSFHDAGKNLGVVVEGYDWDFCQIQLNYMDKAESPTQVGLEGLSYLKSKNIAAVIMEPIKGGKLADKIPESIQAIWANAPVKRTPAEWALKWVADQEHVSVILSGMSDMRQVEENLRILSKATPNALSAEELSCIDKASEEYNKLVKVGCTICRYCDGCPQNISIPAILDMYNQYYMFGKSEIIRKGLLAFTPADRRPSACTACKACEEKCPQRLPISDLMKEAAKEIEL